MYIHFTKTPADVIDCDLLVVAATEEERPLRGAAGLVDWRLYGVLSAAIQEHRFHGGFGESLLVPGSHQLRAKWAVLVGLGSALELTEEAGEHFGQQAVFHAQRLKAVTCGVFYPHSLTYTPYKKNALRWLLKGASSALGKLAKTGFADRLTLLIPSNLEEEVDLTKVIIPKLLSRHGVPGRVV